MGLGKWRFLFALLPPPTPTVHSNSKWNMTCRINDRSRAYNVSSHKQDACTAGYIWDREVSVVRKERSSHSVFWALRTSCPELAFCCLGGGGEGGGSVSSFISHLITGLIWDTSVGSCHKQHTAINYKIWKESLNLRLVTLTLFWRTSLGWT